MSGFPISWAVQYRATFWQRVLLVYGSFIGLFFALVAFGGLTALAVGAAQGTLLKPGEPVGTEITKYVLVAGIALALGVTSIRSSFGSLADVLGFEVIAQGPVSELKATRGSRSASYFMVVEGERVELPAEVFSTLSNGQLVWVRVGRFERDLKELARPANELRKT